MSFDVCEWPLLAGETWNGFISVNGAPPSSVASYFLTVSSGWRDAMRIPLVDGRDFRANDRLTVTIVNQAFANQYFGGENPTGRSVEIVSNEGSRRRLQIVGLVRDARYSNMREGMQPGSGFARAVSSLREQVRR